MRHLFTSGARQPRGYTMAAIEELDVDSHPTSPVFNDVSDLSLPFTPTTAVVHPDRSDSLAATPDGEWGCECGCVVCAERVRELTKKVWRLERALQAKNDTIASLRADNTQKTAEVLEIHQQKLQRAISDKDSAIAVVELQEGLGSPQAEMLKKERGKLMRELREKVQERLKLFRRNSEGAAASLAYQYQNCTREQVCEAVRLLELDRSRLKAYIDQLLAVVLEKIPSLLEGMPRIQQGGGMRLELLTMATLPELLEELQEKEQDIEALQSYASLLVQRIVEQAPDLLESIIQLQETQTIT